MGSPGQQITYTYIDAVDHTNKYPCGLVYVDLYGAGPGSHRMMTQEGDHTFEGVCSLITPIHFKLGICRRTVRVLQVIHRDDAPV